jgi:hypothetical protein
MPMIRIVDLRQEFARAKHHPIISRTLGLAIEERLQRSEQTILFLNRRGFASSLICGKCGYVCECPNCTIPLTLHLAEQRLKCHLCGHVGLAPRKCPECSDPTIRYSGFGTEKVEGIVQKLFPKARLGRMDSDTMIRKDAYRQTLGAFRSGKIDILIGTQMIAKGLDFPNVTLVGIINADIGLHLPDFRAGERTFQLLTQVAGRAGRGEITGEVFVQTSTPFSPSIQFARHHDFDGFWEQESESDIGASPIETSAIGGVYCANGSSTLRRTTGQCNDTASGSPGADRTNEKLLSFPNHVENAKCETALRPHQTSLGSINLARRGASYGRCRSVSPHVIIAGSSIGMAQARRGSRKQNPNAPRFSPTALGPSEPNCSTG